MTGKPGISTLIEEAYRLLQANEGTATLSDLIELLNREPGLFDLPATYQPAATPRLRETVMMRCDGGDTLGMVHVRRCLSVARSLAGSEGLDIRFAIIGDRTAADEIRAAGFAVDVMPEGAEEIDWLLDLAQYHRPAAWLLDIRTALTPHAVLRLKATDTLVAVIDDVSARRLVADAAFYPPLPQVFSLDWSLAEREPAVGWEWVPIEPPVRATQRRGDGSTHAIVAVGGADPQGVTLLAVKALAGIERGLRVTVILAASAPSGLERRIEELAPHVGVLRDPADMQGLLAGADLALISFGTLAWDLAVAGVPGLYVGLNEDHELSAEAFARTGMGVSLGLATSLKEKAIADAVEDLLDDPELRRAMSAAGRMNLDGRGAARIAARLHHLVDERRQAVAVPATQAPSRTGT